MKRVDCASDNCVVKGKIAALYGGANKFRPNLFAYTMGSICFFCKIKIFLFTDKV